MRAGIDAFRFMTGLAVAIGMVTAGTGCAAKPKPEWTAKPLVGWEDISRQRVERTRNGYRILTSRPTQGLFPASLAVTRVATSESDEPETGPHSVLMADPRNEYLQWYSALDDQMAISEVFPITPTDLGGRSVDPEQILASFRALHARLGLIYAVNEPSADQTEMLAVLYDTDSSQPVAVIHTKANSIPPIDDDTKKPDDPWKSDSAALARAQFQRLLHSCIRELISQDEPPALAVPAGYASPKRIRSVEWPPRKSRRRPRSHP